VELRNKDGGMKELTGNRFGVILTAASYSFATSLLCDNTTFEI
jgi:hypothetical protein